MPSVTRRALGKRRAGGRVVETPIAVRPNLRRPRGDLIRQAGVYAEEPKPRERVPNLSSKSRVKGEIGRVVRGAGETTCVIFLWRILRGLIEPGLRERCQRRSLGGGRSG